MKKVKSEEGKFKNETTTKKTKKKKAPGFSMSRKGNANILYQNDHAIISKND